MANDLNQCTFIGRLGRDPESKAMPSGTEVCDFSIAVGWKSKDKEGAEWVNITAFGKLAEICTQYLNKGSQVMISGRMKTESWDKDGVTNYKTKIIADKMQMVGGKSDNPRVNGASTQQPQQTATDGGAGSGGGDFDDDIPFAPLSEHG